MAAVDADQEVPDEELEEGAEGEVASGKKKKRFSGKTLVLFVVLPLLLLGGGLGGAYFAGLFDSFLPASEEEGVEASGEAKEPERTSSMIFFDLPDLLVNLNSPGRKSHYLKISISLELEENDDIKKVQAVLPRIIDNFQIYLRELRVEDLRGSAGLTRLREQLLRRINVAAAPAKVTDILFREMLVQ